MSEQDQKDILFASRNWLDFVAASFIRCADDVHAIRKLLTSDSEHHGHNVKIIAKIENHQGLDNFDEILAAADGIMVARGDLGVEIPFEKVALAQKLMIAKCNAAGKMVITATQMLETMITSPYPTRAEATDVANAVFDGTDCVMLSAETAKGAYPIETVQRMSRICAGAEEAFDNLAVFHALHTRSLGLNLSMDEAIALSSVKSANDLGATLIVTYTNSGRTARLVAKYRPESLVFAMTPFDRTARQLLGYRGVFPVVIRRTNIPGDATPTSAMEESFDAATAFSTAADYMHGMDAQDNEESVDFDSVLIQCLNMARARGIVRVGDFVVVVRSLGVGKLRRGNTNVLRILTVPEPQVSFDSVL
jgi:pyruvate kinase